MCLSSRSSRIPTNCCSPVCSIYYLSRLLLPFLTSTPIRREAGAAVVVARICCLLLLLMMTLMMEINTQHSTRKVINLCSKLTYTPQTHTETTSCTSLVVFHLLRLRDLLACLPTTLLIRSDDCTPVPVPFNSSPRDFLHSPNWCLSNVQGI